MTDQSPQSPRVSRRVTLLDNDELLSAINSAVQKGRWQLFVFQESHPVIRTESGEELIDIRVQYTRTSQNFSAGAMELALRHICNDMTMLEVMAENKAWGRSIRRYWVPGLDLYEAWMVEGGYTSIHRHTKKGNWLSVKSGWLLVERLGSGDEPEGGEQLLLRPGDQVWLPAGHWHRLSASDGEVNFWEVYTGVEVDHLDVERWDVAGIGPLPPLGERSDS